MIDGKMFFDQPVKSDQRTNDDIQQITTGQGNDYTSGCVLDYVSFKNQLRAIDLSKQQVFDADSQAIEQINFTTKSRSSRKHNNVFHY